MHFMENEDTFEPLSTLIMFGGGYVLYVYMYVICLLLLLLLLLWIYLFKIYIFDFLKCIYFK